ncbi:MAG: electron transfer flavoprotein subunit beta/FixA family protein [Thermodesulfovibrionales bacterium]|nr:electron transfer flavoprotein subunit beta/FixA family protein [Thermodesulfovibrionales bacterium]
MRFIVCIKQVPDTAEVRINPETNTLIRDGVPSIINPYDMHAIEAGLSLRDKVGGKVTVITMGPPQAEAALRDALSLGVDDAVLISDRAFAGSDTWATSFTLYKTISKLGYDVIICGKQAIDGDTAQVGPAVAEFLDIPHVAYVSAITHIDDTSITVHRMMDDGYDVVQSSIPVLLTVVKELNEPRLPSLRGKMNAKKAVITKLTREMIGADEKDVGLKGSPTMVKNIFAPSSKKDRRMLEGTPEEQVNALFEELRRLKCV